MSSVSYIDTTLRDLATYPWGSEISADDLATAAGALSRVGAAALEAVDPRMARASMELRTESPWDRLRAVVRHAGSTPVGVVVHGRMLWTDHPVAQDVILRFAQAVAECGARRLRLLDPLNSADGLRGPAEAASQHGLAVIPSIVAGPAPDSGDARWREEAAALGALPGATAICVSDGGGHLSPTHLGEFVQMVREASGLPVEVLIQAPGGLAPSLSKAGVEAGATAVYAAAGPVAMTSARPSAETVRAALVGSGNELSVDRANLYDAARIIAPMLASDRVTQAAAAVYGPVVPLPPDLEAGIISKLGRLGMSRKLLEVADEARAIAAEVGAATLAYPLGDAIVAQAAQHVIDETRYQDLETDLAHLVAGRFGALRGPVDPVVTAAAAKADVDDAPAEVTLASLQPDGGASEEDLVLMAQFPEDAERLMARRRSLRTERDEEGAPAISRVMLAELVQAVEASTESEISVEVSGARVTVRRAAPAVTGTGDVADGGGAGADDGLHRVNSPMVGTFYRAPSPEADPFVKEGQRVEAGQVLCLIEAMKLFNEITSDVAGVVRAINIENGTGVEFGEALFLIETA
ncbi:MAG: acetyl-CoA carboxylase biotin carboxyl carrier protein [Actinobacteria bacterium]|nr:acetyl-CoA carboxylase biotin carboxyl carrier protein [Actinomycetota bacterium]